MLDEVDFKEKDSARNKGMVFSVFVFNNKKSSQS